MRDRREHRAACRDRIDGSPVEDEPSRRSFECDWKARDARPGIPDRQRLLHVGVLNRPPVSRQAFPRLLGGVLELDLDQSWMAEHRDDDRMKRAELQRISWRECGWKRPLLG